MDFREYEKRKEQINRLPPELRNSRHEELEIEWLYGSREKKERVEKRAGYNHRIYGTHLDGPSSDDPTT